MDEWHKPSVMPKPDMETTLYGSAYGSTETDKTNL